jgi:hypothetical protein
MQAAFANNSLGASFSGSGFLIVFFAGVGGELGAFAARVGLALTAAVVLGTCSCCLAHAHTRW